MRRGRTSRLFDGYWVWVKFFRVAQVPSRVRYLITLMGRISNFVHVLLVHVLHPLPVTATLLTQFDYSRTRQIYNLYYPSGFFVTISYPST